MSFGLLLLVCHREQGRRLRRTTESKDLWLLFHHGAGAQLHGMMHAVHEGSYFTYIVASRSHTLYIGVTGNLRERIFKHKWKEYDGFTAKYNCDRLVWFESFDGIEAAIAREKQLKGWKRERKIALIEKMNPTWVDLSRGWYDAEPADFKRAGRMNNQ
jgi:putative endonuclease